MRSYGKQLRMLLRKWRPWIRPAGSAGSRLRKTGNIGRHRRCGIAGTMCASRYRMRPRETWVFGSNRTENRHKNVAFLTDLHAVWAMTPEIGLETPGPNRKRGVSKTFVFRAPSKTFKSESIPLPKLSHYPSEKLCCGNGRLGLRDPGERYTDFLPHCSPEPMIGTQSSYP